MTIRNKLILIVSLLTIPLIFNLAVLGFQFRQVTSAVEDIQQQSVRQQAESLRMQAQLRDAEAALYRFQIEGLPIYASEFERMMGELELSIVQFQSQATTDQELAWAADLVAFTSEANRLGLNLITLHSEQTVDLEQLNNLETLSNQLLTQIRLVNSDNADYQDLVNQMALDLSQAFFAVSSFQVTPNESEITVFQSGIFTFRFHHKQIEALDLLPAEREQVDALALTVDQVDAVGNRLLVRRDTQKTLFNSFVAEANQVGQDVIVNEIQPWAAGRLAQSEATLTNSLFRLLVISGIVSLISVVGAIAITLPNVRQISSSISHLVAGAERVAAGDLSTSIKVSGTGEFTQLGTTFNHMMEDLTIRERRLQRRIAELETLQSVSLDLTGLLDVQLVLDTIVSSGRGLVDASEAHIYLCDDTQTNPRLSASSWRGDEIHTRQVVPRKDGLINTVVRSRRLEIISFAMDHPHYNSRGSETFGLRATAGFPIIRGDRLLGVFNIAFDNRDDMRTGEIRALRLLADQAAVAIENARLYQTVAEKESNLNDLLQKLTLVQEEERRLIGLDLHDGLMQILMSANMHLSTLASLPSSGTNEAQTELILGQSRVREAIDEVQWVVSELRPTELEDFGLVGGLRHYINRVANAEDWEVEFDIQTEKVLVNSAIETAVFRIIQEAISNTRKYADTNRLFFKLSNNFNMLEFAVQDFGIGFDVNNNTSDSNGLGLMGMQERAELLGGTISIESQIGLGTTVSASIPMRWEPEKLLTSASPDAITVLIVDDHQMVRDGLRNMLKTPGVRVIGEARTGKQAVEEVGRLRPDVVLMDIRMPDMDGIEALEEMVGREYESRVIIFTSHQSTGYLLRAVAAGAAGFLLKNISREELLGAIRSVAAGQTRIEQSFFNKALRDINAGVDRPDSYTQVETDNGDPPLLGELTPRERDVLQLVVEGMTYQAIGHTLGISTNTVKGYTKTIFQKLDVTDRTQAAVKAMRLGLVS